MSEAPALAFSDSQSETPADAYFQAGQPGGVQLGGVPQEAPLRRRREGEEPRGSLMDKVLSLKRLIEQLTNSGSGLHTFAHIFRGRCGQEGAG